MSLFDGTTSGVTTTLAAIGVVVALAATVLPEIGASHGAAKRIHVSSSSGFCRAPSNGMTQFICALAGKRSNGRSITFIR